MEWPSIREFLGIPAHLTGKDIAIAVIDGHFPPHPDITTNDRRYTYLVKTVSTDVNPLIFHAEKEPWRNSHGLMTAAAAAGSGSLSSGYYSGAAPEADLYLLETGAFTTVEETESKFVMALRWLFKNWRRYNIRGVVLTVADTRDTGLLPWQVDPIKVHCEQLAKEGLLIIVASGNTKELTCSGPASSPSVLSIGGVIVPQHLHEMSPYHGCQGITFEGKRIPELLAPAENIILPSPFKSAEEFEKHYTAKFDNLPDGYVRTEGTSYAAPIILGSAACIWQANPEWTATQVKAAMVRTAEYKAEWYEAEAGLVHVKAAAMYPVQSLTHTYNPQKLDDSTAARRERDMISNILSSYNETTSRVSTDKLKSLMIHSVSPKVRAAALLAASSEITYIELKDLLRESSSHIKMAVLYTLHNRRDLWNDSIHYVIDLCKDEDLNIQYCAIKVASTIGDSIFLKPLIDGLLEDAVQLRVSIFGARCDALQLLTGITYELEPEFQDGQCWYSERSTESRVNMALKWQQYIEK